SRMRCVPLVTFAVSLAMSACARDPLPGPVSAARRPPTVVAAPVVLPSPPQPTRVHDRAVVLVVMDGVRWQDVFFGADRRLAAARRADVRHLASSTALMPNLHRLVAERGVLLGGPSCTNVVEATGPNYVSLPAYFDLFTASAAHACASNECKISSLPS